MAEYLGTEFVDDTSVEILEGGHDAALDELAKCVRIRQRELQAKVATVKRATTKVGDVIRISAEAPLRPKYLLGGPRFEVSKVNKTTVSGSILDEDREQLPSQRYAYGIRIPLQYIEQV